MLSLRKLGGNPNFFLFLILVLGFFLRVIQLGSTPQGLHADEASFLVNAQAFLETGRDEDGRFLPLSLHSLIDPKPALYSYLAMPFVAAFGATATAVRLPAVIAGVVSLWLVYVVLIQFGTRKNVSLLAAALLAVSPWHIMVSRATQEVILSFVCTLAAVIFFLKYIEFKRSSMLIALAVFSFLAMYFYHSSKVFLMGLGIVWLGIFWWQKKISHKQGGVVVLVLILMLIFSLVIQESSSRFLAVGFLSNQEPQLILDDQIRKATEFSSPTVMRLFYNKGVFYAREFASQYLAHLSPDFLFFSGGEPKRYLIPYHGVLYLIEIPLLALGIFSSIRKNTKYLKLMLGWLVLAPIPAALTYEETPSIIRAFALVVPLMYFIAEGIVWLFQQPRWLKSGALVILIGGYAWSLAYFWQQLSVQQKVSMPWYRNSPYSQIALKLTDIEMQYDKVVVVNDLRPLYSYFALEGLITIEELQSKPLARNEKLYQMGKYVFSQGQCDLGDPQENVLYIAESVCEFAPTEEYDLRIIDSATYDDGVKVYSLITFTKKNQTQ